MEQARGAERRLSLVHSEQEASRPGEGGPGNPTREQFEYLADMIRQMQVLAWQTGCSRVAELLEMAHREADQQRRARPTRLSWLGPA